MKKILKNLALVTLSIFTFLSFENLQAETVSESKKRIKESVEQKENGDVIIPFKYNMSEFRYFENFGYYFLRHDICIINHICQDLDFKKLGSELKEASEKKKYNPFDFLISFLKREARFDVKRVGISTFDSKKFYKILDDGMIIKLDLRSLNKETIDLIRERTNARKNLSTKEEFFDNLKTHKISNFKKQIQEVRFTNSHTLVGYNKSTKEFAVAYHEGNIIWFTEDELKTLCIYHVYYEF